MMNFSELYIVIALVALAILAFFIVYLRKSKKQGQPSKIALFALFLVAASILFGEDRLIGYGLLGAGVLLGVIDIIITLNKR